MTAEVQIPAGFSPFEAGGPFMESNGPLYLLHQGEVVKFGFRVERRHVNPMNNLHGGMMASFCDMLLPLSVHHKDSTVGMRFLPTISLQIDYVPWCLPRAWCVPTVCSARGSAVSSRSGRSSPWRRRNPECQCSTLQVGISCVASNRPRIQSAEVAHCVDAPRGAVDTGG